MREQDTTRLAEALGLQKVSYRPFPKWETCTMYRRPGRRGISFFNPFTNANDDYAVLEWMRGQTNEWRYQFKPALLHFKLETYEPGDYARAALKVINGE